MIRSHSRLSRRTASDLRAIERATTRIEELGLILDRQLKEDGRPEAQLRDLRQATGQITRTANDGIQAYRRVAQALRVESGHSDADAEEIERATSTLAEARQRMLTALEVASRRYPWAARIGPEEEPAPAEEPALAEEPAPR